MFLNHVRMVRVIRRAKPLSENGHSAEDNHDIFRVFAFFSGSCVTTVGQRLDSRLSVAI